jgi:hypothetical protein
MNLKAMPGIREEETPLDLLTLVCITTAWFPWRDGLSPREYTILLPTKMLSSILPMKVMDF